MKPWSQDYLIAAGAYSGFSSMKRLESRIRISLRWQFTLSTQLIKPSYLRSISTSLGRDASPSQVRLTAILLGFPSNSPVPIYSWVERDTVRVSLRTQHNVPGQGWAAGSPGPPGPLTQESSALTMRSPRLPPHP